MLNVKELGGDPAIRPYWSRYYNNDVDGVILVVDSTMAEEDRWSEVSAVLGEVLGHGDMTELSILVLANKQDVDGALSCEQIAAKVCAPYMTPCPLLFRRFLGTNC